jgi:hypothetical protein
VAEVGPAWKCSSFLYFNSWPAFFLLFCSKLRTRFMDASAHLRKLGWRGLGYSLDQRDRGLARPLLITHKTDILGLGSKTQQHRQADQWWLNAFDTALKDLGSGKTVRSREELWVCFLLLTDSTSPRSTRFAIMATPKEGCTASSGKAKLSGAPSSTAQMRPVPQNLSLFGLHRDPKPWVLQ